MRVFYMQKKTAMLTIIERNNSFSSTVGNPPALIQLPYKDSAVHKWLKGYSIRSIYHLSIGYVINARSVGV